MSARLVMRLAVAGLAFPALLQAAVISGAVTDQETGDSIAGAQVILREGTSNGGTGRVWTPVDTTTTDALGVFEFSGVELGTYQVVGSADGYQVRSVQVNVEEGDETVAADLALAPSSETTGTLSVFVGARADSSALAGAAVTAISGGMHGTTLMGATDQDGWVTWLNVSSGTYSVTGTAADHDAAVVQTVVEANQEDTLYLYLAEKSSEGKTVVGTVEDADGNGLLAVVVLISGSGSSRMTLIDTTDTDGAYVISGIPEGNGSARVTASSPGFVPSEQQVSLSGDTTTADFVLEEQSVAVIRGRSASVSSPTIIRNGSGLELDMGRSGPVRAVGADGRTLGWSRGGSIQLQATSRMVFVRSKDLQRAQRLLVGTP